MPMTFPSTMLAFKSYDWPSLLPSSFQTTTVTVTGAVLGDCARASMNVPLSGTFLFAEVTAVDTVTVKQWNPTPITSIDVANGELRVWVDKKAVT